MKHDQRMKHDPQDELIRGLFAQLEQADRDRVPAFSAVVETARARQRSPLQAMTARRDLFMRRPGFSFAITAVLAMVIFFGIRWFGITNNRDNSGMRADREATALESSKTEPGASGPKQGAADPGLAAAPSHNASPGGELPSREKYSSAADLERVRGRKGYASRHPARQESSALRDTRPAAATMAAWRSPTGFLLRTPGDEMMKSVPRLDDSMVRVKLPVDKN